MNTSTWEGIKQEEGTLPCLKITDTGDGRTLWEDLFLDFL